ncbi:MAG: OmpH family outer membrane protein [Bacteroidota bacterium]
MKTHYLLAILLILTLSIGIGVGRWVIPDSPKTGYVFTDELFGNFQMTQELQGKLANQQQAHQLLFDSLSVLSRNVQASSRTIQQGTTSIDSLRQVVRTIQETEARITAEQASQADYFTQQIWTQLSQYVEEFRQQNAFTVIQGISTKGEFCVIDSSLDITQDLIHFVNLRYAGHL